MINTVVKHLNVANLDDFLSAYDLRHPKSASVVEMASSSETTSTIYYSFGEFLINCVLDDKQSARFSNQTRYEAPFQFDGMMNRFSICIIAQNETGTSPGYPIDLSYDCFSSLPAVCDKLYERTYLCHEPGCGHGTNRKRARDLHF